MRFGIDPISLFIVLLGAIILWQVSRWHKRQPFPQLYYSKVSTATKIQSALYLPKLSLAQAPRKLYLTALLLWLIAFLDPHVLSQRHKASTRNSGDQETSLSLASEGIAIYLLLDHSGSMREKVVAINESGKRKWIPKIDLLKDITRQFITRDDHELYDDLIGIITFARSAQVLVPLTLDHQEIIRQLEDLTVVQDRNQDGTAIGYAIYKAAHLIAATRHFASELTEKGEPSYDMKSAMIIVATDGFQDPSPLDKDNRLRNIGLEEAAQYAKEQNIKLYIINIDPKIKEEKYAPHRRLMDRIAKLTGGAFFASDDEEALPTLYEAIARQEKGTYRQPIVATPSVKSKLSYDPSQYIKTSLFPAAVAVGMLLIAIAVAIETLLVRRVP